MAKQPPTTEPDAPEEAPAPSSPSNRPVLKKRVGRKKRHDELEQPDEFMEVGGTIVDWVIANGRSVGAVLAVGLAALLVMGVMEKSQQGTRTDASAALYEARKLVPNTGITFSRGQLLPAVDDQEELATKTAEAVAAFDEIIAQFQGTPQGTVANLEAGSALYRIGKHEEALVYFQKAADGEGDVGLLATSSKGTALESLERYEDAAVAYESASLLKGADSGEALFRLGLVRLNDLNDHEEAAVLQCSSNGLRTVHYFYKEVNI